MRLLALLLALLAWLGVTPPAQAQKTPRHVIILIADDLGRTLGCYGDKVAKTPNIDALAKRGVRFENAYATVASCSPSRACIFSGMQTHSNGQYGLAHNGHHQVSFDHVRSLPLVFRQAGYWTGIIGKYHVLPESVYPFEAMWTKVNARDPVKMSQKAKEFIDQRGNRPFLLVMGFTDPHRAAKGFGNEPFAKDPTEVKFDPKDIIVPYHLPDTLEVRRDLAEYYQSVARLDRGIGMVLEVLRQTGVLDETLIIFLSDNGIPFPGAKTTLYRAGVHLPLIVAAPTQKTRGHANHGLVSWLDVLPTACDWAGVQPPPKAQGKSLLPILDEENPKGWDVVYHSHQFHEITMYYPMRAITTRRYKLIVNLAHRLEYPFASDLYGSPSWQGILKRGDTMMGQRKVQDYLYRPAEELYDLSNDPNELRNLAGDPNHAEVLANLRRRLREWQAATNDPWTILYRSEKK